MLCVIWSVSSLKTVENILVSSQEDVIPAEQRELSRGSLQRIHWEHCDNPLQQSHLPCWCHWVEQVAQRHIHFNGRYKNHLFRILQVCSKCYCVCEENVGFFDLCRLFTKDIAYFPPNNSKHYGITLKEVNQPLLLHQPKERARPGGKVRVHSVTSILGK